MRWPEPCTFAVELDTGLMLGTGSRYQKRFRDLNGLYADSTTFDELVRSRVKT